MAFTTITIWIVLSIAVEFFIEILKQAFPALNTKIKGVDNERLMALVLGFLVCLGAHIDFFEMLGIPFSMTYVGYVFSAVFIAGGSGRIHDFIKVIITIGKKYQNDSVQT